MRTTIAILLLILPTLLLSCTLNQQEPTQDTDATVEARMEATRGTEKAVSPTVARPTNRATTTETNTAYVQPEWIALFTRNPRVLAYRWYKGDKCPTGKYSYRDDLYLFDSKEVLSEVEVQLRNPRENIICPYPARAEATNW